MPATNQQISYFLPFPRSTHGSHPAHWLRALLLALTGALTAPAAADPSAALTEPLAATAPVTFWCSQPVEPGETVVLSAANLSAGANAAVTRLADLDPGSPLLPTRAQSLWQTVKPLQVTPQSMKFVLPRLAPGVFAYRLHAAATIGPVALVNAPDVWFVQGDHGGAASPGGQLGVFGTALAVPAGSSPYPARIALVRNGAVAATVLANRTVPAEAAFGAWFTLPRSLAPGQYTLYFHNGFGGPSAWTRYSSFGHGPGIRSAMKTIDTVTVAAPPAWPAALCPVGLPKGGGQGDDEAFTAAFRATEALGGGVILLSPGTYTLTGTYAKGFGTVLPNRSILRGTGKDGANASVLSFPQMTGSGGPLLAGAPKYVPVPPEYGTGDQYRQGLFAVQNLAVEAPNMAKGTGISFYSMAMADAGWAPFVDNVKLTLGPLGSGTYGVTVVEASNVRITNSDIAAGFPVAINSRGFGCLVKNNRLTWYQIGFSVGHRAQNTVVTGNLFTLPDQTNPGVTLGFPAVNRDLYFAGNTTRKLGKVDFWGMTFDEGNGIYFGYGASSQGNTLTLAKAVTQLAYMTPEGDTVMVVAGTGTGQLRYLVANPTPTTITLDRPLDVAVDSTSVISICTTIGRALFVNNNYGADALDNSFFPSADVIQANNRMTGLSNILIQQTGQYMTPNGIMPGWHHQMLGNIISRGTGKMSVEGRSEGFRPGETNAWYQGSVNQTSILRNNLFGPGVTGLIALQDRISNSLMENNRGPRFQIQSTNVADTLARGNTSNGSGPVWFDNESPGALVLP